LVNWFKKKKTTLMWMPLEKNKNALVITSEGQKQIKQSFKEHPKLQVFPMRFRVGNTPIRTVLIRKNDFLKPKKKIILSTTTGNYRGNNGY